MSTIGLSIKHYFNSFLLISFIDLRERQSFGKQLQEEITDDQFDKYTIMMNSMYFSSRGGNCLTSLENDVLFVLSHKNFKIISIIFKLLEFI